MITVHSDSMWSKLGSSIMPWYYSSTACVLYSASLLDIFCVALLPLNPTYEPDKDAMRKRVGRCVVGSYARTVLVQPVEVATYLVKGSMHCNLTRYVTVIYIISFRSSHKNIALLQHCCSELYSPNEAGQM